MPAFGIGHCTDLLLEGCKAELCQILGDFEAYTLFEPAVTLVVYGTTGDSEVEAMEQCRRVLTTHGAMHFFRCTRKEIRQDVAGAEQAGSGSEPATQRSRRHRQRRGGLDSSPAVHPEGAAHDSQGRGGASAPDEEPRASTSHKV
jgi:hypothetical protein